MESVMRDIYRTLAFASFAITAGSFGIDLVTFLKEQPPATAPESGGPQQTAALPGCNPTLYESARKRLRSEGQGTRPAVVWVGADQQHDYYYRFEGDSLSCEERKTKGPIVSPYLVEGQDPPQTRFAILACLAVMGLSGAGLVVIWSMRDRQMPPPDG
jgi:hypothetical protein